MIDYNNWEIENFIDNKSFNNYALNKNIDDVEKWKAIIDKNPQIKPLTDKAKKVVELLSRAQEPVNKDIEPRLKHLMFRLSLSDDREQVFIGIPVKKIRKVLSYAAAILLFSAIGLNIKHYSETRKNDTEQLFTTIVGTGQKSVVVLPDGTKVWLNSESELSYPVDFGKTNRVVSLVGEGYFNVTHDPENPFLVNTSDLKIKVYGTEFNVKCYKNEDIVEATLVKGSLSIQQQGGDEIFLKPAQKFICHKGTSEIIDNNERPEQLKNEPSKLQKIKDIQLLSHVDTYPVTAWKEQKLVFEDETFADLAVKIERWYDVKVVIQSEKIKQYRYRGSFENETIEQAINALTLATPFSYKFDKRVIYINEL
jgi:ferric-dicitrate binding protein FerR (iron transport regulator)